MRICSLLPSATEIVFALGLGDCIVGVTHECDYPPAAKTKPVIVKSLVDSLCTSREIDRAVRALLGNGKALYTIDFQLLEMARPDLILTQALCEVCALDYRDVVAAAQLLPHKPQVLPLSPTSLADVLDDIKRIGEATSEQEQALTLVASLSERMKLIRRKVAHSSHRPKVLCLEWLEPLYSAGHWVPEMVRLAGGINGLSEEKQPSRSVEWSDVLTLGPDILILMPCGFDIDRTLKETDPLYACPAWSELPAVKQGNVFVVNSPAYFSRSGPRLIDGLEILAQIIHPELFPWRMPLLSARRLG